MSALVELVELQGRKLEMRRRAAPPGAATLVFLHHGLGSLSLWRDFPDRLAARTGMGAVVYSRLGHGSSDAELEPRPPDFLLREGRERLPALLETLGLRDVVLVGHSDGGTIALAYLAAGHRARRAPRVR